MSLFGTPSAPAEDPAVKAERERQQRQAENLLTQETQTDLRRRTMLRLRFYGRGPAVADYNAANPPSLRGFNNPVARSRLMARG